MPDAALYSPDLVLDRKLQFLVGQAQKGDPTVLPELRKLLDLHPEIARNVGDVSRIAEEAWISILARKDAVRVESIRRQASEMRTKLLSQAPSELERLHADQVVLSWLQLSAIQVLASRSTDAEDDKAMRRVALAQRSYLAALKAFEQLQGLTKSRRAKGPGAPLTILPIQG